MTEEAKMRSRRIPQGSRTRSTSTIRRRLSRALEPKVTSLNLLGGKKGHELVEGSRGKTPQDEELLPGAIERGGTNLSQRTHD